ncbi:MAG: ABC transporter permease [Oscillospiraceae bacterium]
MKMTAFSSRVTKEILRDPLTLIFGIGFPVILLLLLTAIQSNAPVEIFRIETLTPGVAVFGFSFLTLFSAQLIAGDRASAMLQRLFTTPLSALDFIAGYLLPLFPMAVAQCIICFVTAIILGLKFTTDVLITMLILIPSALFFIGLGLLCGTVLNEKAVGGLCGALLTNLTAFTSGAWFDLAMVGGGFKKVCDLLPFSHSVNIGRAALAGNYGDIFPDMFWVIGYMLAAFIAAIILFTRKMKSC